jgi:hypothetical protein
MNQNTTETKKYLCVIDYACSAIVKYFVLFLFLYVTVDKTMYFGDKGATEARIAYITAFVLSVAWIAIDLSRHKPIATYKLPRLRVFISGMVIDLIVLLVTGLFFYMIGRIRIDDPLDQFLLVIFFASSYSFVFKLYQWQKVRLLAE